MNHGIVARELFEYRDAGLRIVGCELADGWHVVEIYQPKPEGGNRCIHRHVCEHLHQARDFARTQAFRYA